MAINKHTYGNRDINGKIECERSNADRITIDEDHGLSDRSDID